jgi:hypothetical protein
LSPAVSILQIHSINTVFQASGFNPLPSQKNISLQETWYLLCFCCTICFEFDCHFVPSCINKGGLFWGLGFSRGYYNVCGYFCRQRFGTHSLSPSLLFQIMRRYYGFQTDGEVHILFSALVSVQVIEVHGDSTPIQGTVRITVYQLETENSTLTYPQNRVLKLSLRPYDLQLKST